MKTKKYFLLQQVLVLLLMIVVFAACGKKKSESSSEKQPPKKKEAKSKSSELTSTAFKAGQQLPKKYAGKKTGINPPLSWKNFNTEADAFVLILSDKDAPEYVHWYVAMPKTVTSLPEGIDKSVQEPKVSGVKIYHDSHQNSSPYYKGPEPTTTHNYEFRLYALATTIDVIKIYFATGRIKDFKSEAESFIKDQRGLKAKILDTAVLPFIYTP